MLSSVGVAFYVSLVQPAKEIKKQKARIAETVICKWTVISIPNHWQPLEIRLIPLGKIAAHLTPAWLKLPPTNILPPFPFARADTRLSVPLPKFSQYVPVQRAMQLAGFPPADKNDPPVYKCSLPSTARA